jgi:hypothetical protein
VGEEKIALLHVQQGNPPLSHQERHAAVQRFNKRDVGEGSRRTTDLRILALERL